MKKIFTVAAAVLFCLGGFVFADETEDLLKEPVGLETVVITPEDQHVTKKTAKVWIEYNNLTEEAIVYYTCQSALFEQGDAINTIREVLLDFEEENSYARFYSYRHIRKDTLKYYKEEGFDWALYQSYVKLYK